MNNNVSFCCDNLKDASYYDDTFEYLSGSDWETLTINAEKVTNYKYGDSGTEREEYTCNFCPFCGHKLK